VQQSNYYIIFYAVALTVVCGSLLAIASEGLKDRQQANIALEQKANILSTVMELKEGDNIEKLYADKVQAFVIDFEGNKLNDLQAASINVGAEYKKAPKDRLLPVYEFRSASNPNEVEFVVLPVYGYGLWNNIWGFVALESDMNTLKGVKFQHTGETPGLGARITEPELQARYVGKTIFEGQEILSIEMMKGEGNDYSNDVHKVDGMSGATLTAKGVNNMLLDYFQCYKNYLSKLKS